VYSFKYKADEFSLHPVQDWKRNISITLKQKGVRRSSLNYLRSFLTIVVMQHKYRLLGWLLHSLHQGLFNQFKWTPLRRSLNIILLSRTGEDLDGHMEVLPE